MKKHPLAIAWDKWKKRSPESFPAATLGKKKFALDGKPDSYLENRLRAAFSAGAAAQRQIYLKALASADVVVEAGYS